MTVTHIIIPDSGTELLRQELADAFTESGFTVTRANPQALSDSASIHYLPLLLKKGKSLFFSVNFQGLTNLKATLEVLAENQSIAAVWCVDNPWNILSGVRSPLWKSIPIFITDMSFIHQLKENGAHNVFYLPLATSPKLFAKQQQTVPHEITTSLSPIVFVGRSAFPEKASFFSGLTLPGNLLEESVALLNQGARPDLLWWFDKLAINTRSLWPGKHQRLPAFGAEQTSLAWRSLCLKHATDASFDFFSPANKHSLDIFGDSEWSKNIPPHARLLTPVDYYTHLASIYATARYSLSLTSFMLPAGLNQRHFDVWMAGGMCLTDNTPGLNLFPLGLTEPVTFTSPHDIKTILSGLESMKQHHRTALTQAWQAEILSHHTYVHRVREIFDTISTAC